MPDNMVDGFDFEEVVGESKEAKDEVFGGNMEENNPRPMLNVLFLLDTSGSMSVNGGVRINQLNTAMATALQAARGAATALEAQVVIRAIAFNSSARWVIGDPANGVLVDEALRQWKGLTAEGTTDTAAAIRLGLEMMHTRYLGTDNYHPVVILVTDGDSDKRSETQAAIEELRMALSGGDPKRKDKVWRFAIGVENYNEAELLDFAMLGKTEDEFGNQEENKPMMFKVDQVDRLEKILAAVTKASLYSAMAAGNTGGGQQEQPVVPIDVDDIEDI